MKILFLMRDDGFMTEPMNIMELSSLAKEGHPERSTHIAVIERDDIVTIAKELSFDARPILLSFKIVLIIFTLEFSPTEIPLSLERYSKEL